MSKIPRWYLVFCHVAVVALFLGVAIWHVQDLSFMRWEFVVLVAAASLPFLLPLLSVYVKGIGKDGITFQFLIPEELRSLPEARQSALVTGMAHSAGVQQRSQWTLARADEYERVHGYMLAHVYKHAKSRVQQFSVFIFLVRHEKGTSGPPRKHFEEIDKLEFFFGDSWSNQVFTVSNTGGVLGVRTEAWGTFLATCRVVFRESSRDPVILHRYIDFHMLQGVPEDA